MLLHIVQNRFGLLSTFSTIFCYTSSVALPACSSFSFLKFICFPFRIQLVSNWIKYQEQRMKADSQSNFFNVEHVTPWSKDWFFRRAAVKGFLVRFGCHHFLMASAMESNEVGSKCRLISTCWIEERSINVLVQTNLLTCLTKVGLGNMSLYFVHPYVD